jgi:hypothetical protein
MDSTTRLWVSVAGFWVFVLLLAALNKALIRRVGRTFGLAAVYRVRDDYVSRTELAFYQQLRVAAADWAVVMAKVNLGDVLYSPQVGAARFAAWNRINRKHFDFVLCNPHTLRPLLAIELDDRSHALSRRVARDTFVNNACVQAGLPLLRVPVTRQYDPAALAQQLRTAVATPVPQPYTPAMLRYEAVAPASPLEMAPACPRCGATMVQRVARQGARTGGTFWGCPNYPRCRGIVRN